MTMERKLEAAESVLSKALTELREVKAERDRLLAINAQVAGENIKLRKVIEERIRLADELAEAAKELSATMHGKHWPVDWSEDQCGKPLEVLDNAFSAYDSSRGEKI